MKTKFSLGTLVGFISVMTLAACGNSGGGGGSTPAPAVSAPVVPPVVVAGFGTIMPGYGAGCSNCFPSPAVILSGVKAQVGSNSNFVIDILVPTSAGLTFQDPTIVNTYQGPIAIQGVANISAGDADFCSIAPGPYTITTTQVGTMVGRQFTGVNLTLTGPGGTMTLNVLGTGQIVGANPNYAAGMAVQGGINTFYYTSPWLLQTPTAACPAHAL